MRLATIQGPLEIGLDAHRYVPAAKMDQAVSRILDRKAPHNIGDWFVTKVTDRLLDYDEVVRVGRDAGGREWDYVNQECDLLVLKGSNYIQPDWLTRTFGLELFKKIKIPIVLFGVGLQANISESVLFEAEELEILKYIHENACSSVRGNATAEALERVGIKNVVVTGCPTLFWSRQPELRLREPHDAAAGFSFRQWLYSRDQSVYEAQLRAAEIVRDRFSSVTVILQGEEILLQHYLQSQRWEAEFGTHVTTVPDRKLVRIERTKLESEVLRREIHKQYDPLTRPAFCRLDDEQHVLFV